MNTFNKRSKFNRH